MQLRVQILKLLHCVIYKEKYKIDKLIHDDIFEIKLHARANERNSKLQEFV